MINKLFIQYYKKRIARYFEDNSSARILTAAAMLMTFFLVGLGVFLFAARGFEFAQEEEFIANAAPLYIYEMFILVTGFLIFASAAISGIFTFFRKQGSDQWIAATPAYKKLSWLGFAKVTIGASWPFILIALPIVLAARSVFGFGAAGLLFSLLSLFAFSIFCAALGAFAVFISAYAALALGSRSRRFRSLVLFSVLLILLGGFWAWDGLINVNIGELFQIEDIELTSATTERIADNFKYYPSHISALAMHSVQTGNISAAAGYLAQTLFMLILSIGAYGLLQARMLKLWQVFAEGGFEARKRARKTKESGALYRLTSTFANLNSLKSPSRALFKKELLENFRTAKNVLWAGFLALLMFLNIFLISIVGDRLGAGRAGEMTQIIPSLQFAVIIFFAGAFVLRFVFPSFSQEGRASWIIGSSPVSLRVLFFQKMKLYLLLSAAIGGAAAVVFFFRSSEILARPEFAELALSFPWLVFLPSVLIFSLAIAAIGLSLGVVFVNFKIENPQLMSTSLPGMFLVFSFLLFGFLGAFSLHQFVLGTHAYIVTLNVVVGFLAAISVVYALKALQKIEFV